MEGRKEERGWRGGGRRRVEGTEHVWGTSLCVRTVKERSKESSSTTASRAKISFYYYQIAAATGQKRKRDCTRTYSSLAEAGKDNGPGFDHQCQEWPKSCIFCFDGVICGAAHTRLPLALCLRRSGSFCYCSHTKYKAQDNVHRRQRRSGQRQLAVCRVSQSLHKTSNHRAPHTMHSSQHHATHTRTITTARFQISSPGGAVPPRAAGSTNKAAEISRKTSKQE
jgi:hypothetical protein